MEAKYLDLLDDEVRAFIRATEEFYPPDAVEASVEKQREYYNALCAAFDSDRPSNVNSCDLMLASPHAEIPLRRYEPSDTEPDTMVLYFHGGGYVVGGLESHDAVCAEICSRTGFSVNAVDYRLSPEFVHPAAYDDCLFTFRHFAGSQDLPIILAGDSAGGNLAAAVSQTVRGEVVVPIGQVLIYPALGGDASKGSYLDHANAPMLTTSDMQYYHKIRMGDKDASNDPTAHPLTDSSFSDLPPTVIFSAECDPLADDGDVYCQKLREAGGKAQWFNEKGLVHSYLRARKTSTRAKKSFDRIIEALKALARNDWPYM